MVKKFLATLLIALVPMLTPALVSADSVSNAACSGANNLSVAPPSTTEECQNLPDQADTTDSWIKTVVNILSLLVGIAAVIMLIIGGFRYITSGGSSEKITSAKNTIIYAIIGLVIVALAQLIVQLVLTKSINGTTGTTKPPSCTGSPLPPGCK